MGKKFFLRTLQKNQQPVKVYFCLLMRRRFVAPITEVQRLVDSWIIQALSGLTFYIATYSGAVMEGMPGIPYRRRQLEKVALN